MQFIDKLVLELAIAEPPDIEVVVKFPSTVVRWQPWN